MRKFHLYILGAMLFGVLVFAARVSRAQMKRSGSEDMTAMFSILDHIWLNSARNHDPIPQGWLFANEFVEVHNGGEVVDRQTQMDQIATPSSGIAEIHPDDVVIRFQSPDVVITTDTTTIGRSVAGKVAVTKYHVLRVYAKEAGRWKAAAAGLVQMGVMTEHGPHSEEHGGKDIQGAVASQLIDLDKQWLHAALTGNTSYMASLFSDKFIEIHAGGDMVTKQQQIDQIKSPNRKMTDLHPDDIHVRLLSQDLALVTDTTTMAGASEGRDNTGKYRVLRVFVKENGKWKAAGAALTPLAS